MLTKVSAFFMTFFVYVLQSQVNNSFYKGSTNDLQRRLVEHNTGKEKSTSRYLPWNLVWFAAKPDRSEAVILDDRSVSIPSVTRQDQMLTKVSAFFAFFKARRSRSLPRQFFYNGFLDSSKRSAGNCLLLISESLFIAITSIVTTPKSSTTFPLIS